MNTRTRTAISACYLALAGLGALVFSVTIGATRVSADSERSGAVHITKNCSGFTGIGGYCTITSSNIPEIKAGSRVYYTAGSVLPILLDSNAVIYVGPGDWAVGRCTLDLPSTAGLCTFSDGTGQLAGFKARINVSPFPNFVDYHWDGTYRLGADSDQ